MVYFLDNLYFFFSVVHHKMPSFCVSSTILKESGTIQAVIKETFDSIARFVGIYISIQSIIVQFTAVKLSIL